MARGELFLRKAGTATWVDAFDTYGMSLTNGSLSLLATPAPNKDAIENKSRLQHGKRVLRSSLYARKDEREVMLQVHFTAPTEDEFWERYQAFCEDMLDYGFFDIRHKSLNFIEKVNGVTKKTPKIFRMTYVRCEEFSQYLEQLAKYILTLNEPDPSNRGLVDSWNSGYTFTSVTPGNNDNPVTKKWYEREDLASKYPGIASGYNYLLTGDTTPKANKTYYRRLQL